jgi:GNAT superfamily N-acetyltransferase
MAQIVVRRARPGDGEAMVRIHGEMAAYYGGLAPRHFQVPVLDGLAAELDAELANVPATELHLVAEDDAEIVGALAARLLEPEPGAERQIAPDLGATRLRIDYLATAETHRRRGIGVRLVEAAEEWGRGQGATVAETWTYRPSPLSMPFWTGRMAFEERSVNLRKRL